MSEPTIEEHLRTLRERFAQQGPEGLVGTESVWDEVSREPPPDADPEAEGSFYELLAYDALALDRPGWAYVCMRASQAGFQQGGRMNAVVRVRDAAQAILEAFFPPYDDDLAMLADIRRWLWARALQLTEAPGIEEALREGSSPSLPAPVANKAVALKHRWLFRLVRTHQVGRLFRIDRVFGRFPLTNDDQVILRVLAAAHDDRVLARVSDPEAATGLPLTVGWLVTPLADTEPERVAWLRRFDGRAPLLRFGLVDLGTPQTLEQALRDRPVHLDETVLAAVEGRDYWPLDMERGATLQGPLDRAVSPRVQAAIDALHERGDAEHLHLIATTRRASLDAVRAWSARRGSGEVLDVRPGAAADPAFRRAIARHARLRNALVLIGSEVADQHAEALASLLPTPVLHHHDRASGWPLGIEVEPPQGAEAVLAWNTALADEGLAELNPAVIDETLVPLGLDEADIRALARLARPHGPRIPAEVLSALADQRGLGATR